MVDASAACRRCQSGRLIPPRQRRQLEARPQRPSSGLGVTMMRRAMIAGKCGLPTLRYVPAEATTPAKTGRAPWWRLGIDMMRRVSGRYKGVKGCVRAREGLPE